MRRLLTGICRGLTVICVMGCVSVSAWGQAMVSEAAAAAAGSSVGTVAGRQMSKGISGILGKLGEQADKAARTGDSTLLKVGPGVAVEMTGETVPAAPAVSSSYQNDPYNVPPPPPLASEVAARSRARQQAQARAAAEAAQAATPPPPPPPVMTAENIRTVQSGMDRNEVLSMGAPAARITMSQDGHLVEVFRYRDNGAEVGTVRLSDGAVLQVDVP